mmetsp:Transcript_3840/g.7244  ORF Transcript_3840/g.7244 Transcript_3840/m.7244 type:complete len:227 (-) Transcript_3840:676-1356(-)
MRPLTKMRTSRTTILPMRKRSGSSLAIHPRFLGGGRVRASTCCCISATFFSTARPTCFMTFIPSAARSSRLMAPRFPLTSWNLRSCETKPSRWLRKARSRPSLPPSLRDLVRPERAPSMEETISLAFFSAARTEGDSSRERAGRTAETGVGAGSDGDGGGLASSAEAARFLDRAWGGPSGRGGSASPTAARESDPPSFFLSSSSPSSATPCTNKAGSGSSKLSSSK